MYVALTFAPFFPSNHPLKDASEVQICMIVKLQVVITLQRVGTYPYLVVLSPLSKDYIFCLNNILH